MTGLSERERLLVEAIPTAYIAIDREGHYLAFNDAAAALLGGRPAPGDRAGAPRYVKLFHPDGVTPMADDEIPIVRALGGEVFTGVELVIQRAGETAQRHVAASASPIRDASGVVMGASVVLHDITELVAARKRIEDTARALERTQKMDAIGRLAGAVAHDFNNLLTVIASYAHMLEPTFDEGDERVEDVAEIRRATERASALTKQLLLVSRQGPSQAQRLDLAAIVTALAAPFRRLAGPHTELIVHAHATPPVDLDLVQIEQALINLVINARDAMPDGGRLVIETGAEDLDEGAAQARGVARGRYATISVTDTGVGMDRATQRRVFEPYFTTKDARGTGLGLSIVHGVVQKAGGAITVYSELGQGSTFRLFFPIATGEAAVAPAPPPIEPPERLPPLRVLVADDDRHVRTAAARILVAAGCTVIEASSADEARHACVGDEAAIDVLLTDVILGGDRGDVLARDLAELRPGLRTVIMSGFPAGAIATSGRLLQKPFSPAELRTAIGGAIAAWTEGSGPIVPDPGRPGVARVLVVDDDALVRRSIVRVLKLAGFAVTEADGGVAASAQLEHEHADVVISDLEMPGGGGLDLLRRVRRIDLDVPVILITGKPDVTSAARAIEHGVFRYMTKPLDLGALEKAVRHASRAHALAKIRRQAFSASGNIHARHAADRAGLEVRLDAALDSLWLAFQPIVDARTGAPFGVEALLRSDEPSMPSPMDVLDAATELGRIYQLGRRIRALAAAAIATRGDDLVFFVNLHPDELGDAELVADAAPLVPFAKRIVLEVTERASLRSSAALSARFAKLRELGFRLAIDDIGAGYSGLTSFADLIPEVVKVDMSLVRDVHTSAVKQRTIRSLCALSHEIGSIVVGEGVETEAERDCLRELGCDLFQGYFFGRPQRALP
ncbi:MAG TPA: EAL domain-containing protein [Kofleriaceae bacterium]|nr:EAL domain-containing protein [Kofleriaceae bacterium]